MCHTVKSLGAEVPLSAKSTLQGGRATPGTVPAAGENKEREEQSKDLVDMRIIEPEIAALTHTRHAQKEEKTISGEPGDFSLIALEVNIILLYQAESPM